MRMFVGFRRCGGRPYRQAPIRPLDIIVDTAYNHCDHFVTTIGAAASGMVTNQPNQGFQNDRPHGTTIAKYLP